MWEPLISCQDFLVSLVMLVVSSVIPFSCVACSILFYVVTLTFKPNHCKQTMGNYEEFWIALVVVPPYQICLNY